MAVAELQTGVNWIFWLVLGTPPVMLLALAGLARRWWRSRRLKGNVAAYTDARSERLSRALTKPRQRRAAVVDRQPGNPVLTGAGPELRSAAPVAADIRRPGLTARWKGDHRIVMGR
jgi:hypothetical protein